VKWTTVTVDLETPRFHVPSLGMDLDPVWICVKKTSVILNYFRNFHDQSEWLLLDREWRLARLGGGSSSERASGGCETRGTVMGVQKGEGKAGGGGGWRGWGGQGRRRKF
jgi:uncharacterized membrane protein YgcG